MTSSTNKKTQEQSDHGTSGHVTVGGKKEVHAQKHPLKLYFVVWILLFVLSACSYAIDYFNFQGYLRWTLILIFMFLKAGAIVAIFMHMAWERLALVYAILAPPLALIVFIALMAFEGDYTNFSRITHFAKEPRVVQLGSEHGSSSLEQHESMPSPVAAATSAPTPAAAPTPTAKGPDALADLIKDAKQWVSPTGDYANTRHSALKQITTENAGKLQLAWQFSTGVLRGHEGAAAGVGALVAAATGAGVEAGAGAAVLAACASLMNAGDCANLPAISLTARIAASISGRGLNS
ncbi:MAG: cytochrome C oxidase subunit IV family protein [Methylocystis sp.]